MLEALYLYSKYWGLSSFTQGSQSVEQVIQGIGELGKQGIEGIRFCQIPTELGYQSTVSKFGKAVAKTLDLLLQTKNYTFWQIFRGQTAKNRVQWIDQSKQQVV